MPVLIQDLTAPLTMFLFFSVAADCAERRIFPPKSESKSDLGKISVAKARQGGNFPFQIRDIRLANLAMGGWNRNMV